MASYISFASQGREGVDTFYVPGGNPGLDLARKLAVDVYTHQRRLREAYLDHVLTMRVLIPRQHLPADIPESVTNGTVLGVPFHVVEGIDEPMLAYPLKFTDLP